jgi:hypothetical protein
MPEQRQTIVNPAIVTPRSKGTRNDVNLKASFPHSPIYLQDLTDEERKKTFQELALDGEVLNGHGINKFNRDFTGTTQNPVPNLEDVETGGGGLPASPYVPNLTSPGPGSFNASDQPVYAGELPNKDYRNSWGVGLGGLVSPAQTSQEISKQGTLGSYISGRSYQGSDGKS